MKSLIKISMATICGAALATSAYASSHREAPAITETPKVDGTDFYMFNSYETGRSDFVTIIANYLPLQDGYGGPNFFTMDPNAVYDINIDNSGDAKEDITFRFEFTNILKDLTVPVGGKRISVALTNIGGISAADSTKLNVDQSYRISVLRGGTTKNAKLVTNAADGRRSFKKPVDNIGNKSIADYAAYSNSFIYEVVIPGCTTHGKVFVGQRRDPFVVNLGETFDLVNFNNPLGSPSAEKNTLADKNVTSIAMEIPKACLISRRSKVIAGWTTASLPKNRSFNRTHPSFDEPFQETGDLVQVSRLANPLVNELVIGLKDKNKFNASKPKDDAQFAKYVTNPSLPFLLQALFPAVTAPTKFPRTDLVAIFLTGVTGLNKTTATAELMRLNTDIPAVPASSQNSLGVIAGDNAGYPNGRRVGDDVVDISLRALMGVLLPLTDAPSGQLPFTDGAANQGGDFPIVFPYLNTPTPGSPDPTSTN